MMIAIWLSALSLRRSSRYLQVVAHRVTTMAPCNPGGWLERTQHNSVRRRAVVIDSWSHIGMGHTLQASGEWISNFIGTNRSLRFAFCVPRRVASAFAARGNVMPPCEESRFDLHEHLTFANLTNLRATDADFPVPACGEAALPFSQWGWSRAEAKSV